MGFVNLELKIIPTSVAYYALEIEGHLSINNASKVELTFNEWIITLSKASIPDIDLEIKEGRMIFSCTKKIEVWFECTLFLTKNLADKVSIFPQNWRNPLWAIVPDLYPFVGKKLILPVIVKSDNNNINLTVSVSLPKKIISYQRGGVQKGFEATYTYDDENRTMFSGYESGEEIINKTFISPLRYKPFFSFQSAVTPIVYLYAVTFLTQIIGNLSTISLEWTFFGFTIKSDVPFRLLQHIINAYFFTRISRIQIGLNTRCLLQFLKGFTWIFIGLLTIHVEYPTLLVSLAVKNIHVFDLFLKFSQIWVITAAIIALSIYPYVENKETRSNLITILIFLSGLLALIIWRCLPSMESADFLLNLSI